MVTLWLGFYGHKLLYAENDQDAAKARAANATKAAWKARRVILVVGFIAFAAAWKWVHQHGA